MERSFCERRRPQPPTRAPYLRLRRNRGRMKALTPPPKKSNFEARRRRQARSATPSRPSAERGGLDGVRRRLPETSAPMVICAAGLSPVRGLPHRKRPHYCLLTPSPSCAAGSLASARSPRTARIPQARRLLCSSTGQRCCLTHAGVSHGVLTRRAHTACSYTAYAQLNASPSPPRPHPLFS